MLGVWTRISGISEVRAAMMAGWRELSTLTKIFYIGGQVSFIGLAIMILTVRTSIDAIWEFLKRCPFCM
jgi:hypothetical protein